MSRMTFSVMMMTIDRVCDSARVSIHMPVHMPARMSTDMPIHMSIRMKMGAAAKANRGSGSEGVRRQ